MMPEIDVLPLMIRGIPTQRLVASGLFCSADGGVYFP